MNNPNVFPSEETIRYHDRQDSYIFHEGMSLRDYFAAKAIPVVFVRNIDEDIYFNERADDCYKIADEMLKARSVKRTMEKKRK